MDSNYSLLEESVVALRLFVRLLLPMDLQER